MSDDPTPASRLADLVDELRGDELDRLVRSVDTIRDGIGCLTDLAVRFTANVDHVHTPAAPALVQVAVAEIRADCRRAAAAGCSHAYVRRDAIEQLLAALRVLSERP